MLMALRDLIDSNLGILLDVLNGLLEGLHGARPFSRDSNQVRPIYDVKVGLAQFNSVAAPLHQCGAKQLSLEISRRVAAPTRKVVPLQYPFECGAPPCRLRVDG